MATQLKNLKFSDKVAEADANGNLGDIKATVESGDATHDGHIYLWLEGNRYSCALYNGEYGMTFAFTLDNPS